MARNLTAAAARPRAALFQPQENRDQQPQQQARHAHNGAYAGWWRDNLLLLMIAFGIVILPPVVYYLAQYCIITPSPAPLLTATCSWLTLFSPEQWVLVRKVFWIAAILLMAVLEGINAWREGRHPLGIAVAVVYLLLQESFWYDIRFH